MGPAVRQEYGAPDVHRGASRSDGRRLLHPSQLQKSDQDHRSRIEIGGGGLGFGGDLRSLLAIRRSPPSLPFLQPAIFRWNPSRYSAIRRGASLDAGRCNYSLGGKRAGQELLPPNPGGGVLAAHYLWPILKGAPSHLSRNHFGGLGAEHRLPQLCSLSANAFHPRFS